VSQFSGCATVSTRSDCVTTLGLSNSSNPQCFCHNSRAVQQFQPAVLVSQLSRSPIVPTRSDCVTTLGRPNSSNPHCLCHNSWAVQLFQPAVLVSQLSFCPTIPTHSVVSQHSGCPTDPTRCACVITLGLSNRSNPQFLCHNSRAVQ